LLSHFYVATLTGDVRRGVSEYEYVNSRTVAIKEKRVTTRDGYVVFDDAELADVVEEFNRNNEKKIVIADPSLATIHLGGNLRASNTEAFLALLQVGFPIIVEQTEAKVVLKRRDSR
jgi:transmembrane sensor